VALDLLIHTVKVAEFYNPSLFKELTQWMRVFFSSAMKLRFAGI